VRIQPEAAERELGHIGPPDDDQPGPTPARDCCRVALGWSAIEHERSSACPLSANVEEILHRDRDAGVRRRLGSGAAKRVHSARCEAGTIGVDMEEGSPALTGRIMDPGQTLIDQCRRAGAAGREVRS
jgi:hypothetical protein